MSPSLFVVKYRNRANVTFTTPGAHTKQQAIALVRQGNGSGDGNEYFYVPVQDALEGDDE